MLALPNQTPGLIQQYGLTQAQVDFEVWAVNLVGDKFAGAAAANRVLAELSGLWPALAALYALPPVRWIEDCLYRWVAENRARLSGFWGATPECEVKGVECE
ncbi:MAG: DUF393 domain-containing protein [Chloroflexi bacterium]|nr:DUF393 domain-containing protein [Chloroflexota bacterium]